MFVLGAFLVDQLLNGMGHGEYAVHHEVNKPVLSYVQTFVARTQTFVEILRLLSVYCAIEILFPKLAEPGVSLVSFWLLSPSLRLLHMGCNLCGIHHPLVEAFITSVADIVF